MKYQLGDIVEIITAKYKSWSDIPAHEKGYYENNREFAPFVGQRFRVGFVGEERIGAIIDDKMCLHTHPDCLMLVKRKENDQ